MATDPNFIADWANLPPDLEAKSLWESVHDADLRSIRSDLLGRSLTLMFEVPYLASGVTFAFMLHGVQSARVFRFAVWPGDFPLPSHLKWEEYQQQMGEYRKLWRQESESWTTFESCVNSAGDAEFTDGDKVDGDGVVALRLGVQMTSGERYELFVRAEKLVLTRSDQEHANLSDFLALGHTYWEGFAKRGTGLLE